jgi:hypothetical protein
MDEVAELLENRIFSGTPFTHGQLCDGAGPTAYATADRLIQKYRRLGLISSERSGRSFVWSLTSTGQKERATRSRPIIKTFLAPCKDGTWIAATNGNPPLNVICGSYEEAESRLRQAVAAHNR